VGENVGGKGVKEAKRHILGICNRLGGRRRRFFRIFGGIVPPEMGLNGRVLRQFLTFFGKN
jgi:hypothetical protein